MLVNIHTHSDSDAPSGIINLYTFRKDDHVFTTGIHPKEAREYLHGISHIQELAKDPRCLGIGECGLDKVIDVPMAAQYDALKAQIEISEAHSLPLILHCVKAWNEILEVRKALRPQQRWIFHGFRKTGLLPGVLKEGLIISIGTAVLYDRKLQEIVPLIPDNRLFLETDDDPDHSIEEVYAKVAGLKKIPVEELQEKIFANFLLEFPKWKN